MPDTSDAHDGKQPVRLGAVQETLFIPLAARARESLRKRPLLHDPKAVELIRGIDYPAEKYGPGPGSSITVLRTAIVDSWVRAFLAEHPAGTVVEIGTGLNTRFERVDNGSVHWIDLDLPDTIALRRRFFTDSERRRTVAASVLEEAWPREVEEYPGPFFFVAEGVLVYLPQDQAAQALTRIAERFPGAHLALDTYPRRLLVKQHQQAERKGMAARWAWSCEDPRSLERLGLRLVEAASVTRPPHAVRARLPPRLRLLLPLADRLLHGLFDITLFRTGSRPG